MVLETFSSSGLSVRQFCKREGLSEPTFYSWRKKLSGGKNSTQASLPFIEVKTSSADSAVLELVLSAGAVLRIGSAVDRKTLADALGALREVGLC